MKVRRPYPTHEVVRGPWENRLVVTVASGLTFDEAREVAREMRGADPRHRFSVRSMTLEGQARALGRFTVDVSDLPPLPDTTPQTNGRLDADPYPLSP